MYYFIVNTTSRSGKGAGLWKSIKNYLDDNNVLYKAYKTKYPGHATELAKKISEAKSLSKNLIIVGGDGTINEAINGILDFSQVNVGVIPTGSGNDFAKGHGISLSKSPTEVLEDILNNTSRRQVDLGKVYWNDYKHTRLFAISAGVGLDAIVCKKALTSKLKVCLNKIGLGSLTYSLLTVATLFSMTKFGMQTVVDNVAYDEDDIIYSALLLGPYEGGGVMMAPEADPSDGLFDVCMAGHISKIRTFPCLPLLIKGKHTKLKAFSMKKARQYSINTTEPVVLHTDGEYLGDVTGARFECLEKVLTLLNSEE